MAELTGGCLGGCLRCRAEGPPLWRVICQCESRRRANSAPVVACMGFRPRRAARQGDIREYHWPKG